MPDLNRVAAKVSVEKDVYSSATALVEGLGDEIIALKADTPDPATQAMLDRVGHSIKERAAALSNALVANTDVTKERGTAPKEHKKRGRKTHEKKHARKAHKTHTRKTVKRRHK